MHDTTPEESFPHLSLVPAPKRGSYDRSARAYDFLVGLWSNRRIGMLKRMQLDHIAPNERVLYAGVGTGDDAVGAVQRGAKVTGVDISAGMLEVARHRLRKVGLEAELLCEDLFTHRPAEKYDVVCANFLLDTFHREPMERLVAHLVSLLRPGGRLLLADIALPQGSWPARAFVTAHHFVAFGLSALEGVTPLFPVYDYPRVFEAAGLKIAQQQFLRLWPFGPITYQLLSAVKPTK